MVMITLFLLLGTLARWSQVPSPSQPSCFVQAPSVLSRSSSGVAQVSNLQLIYLECRRSPPRALPQSGQQLPLTVEAVVYHVSDDGAKVRVPSQVMASGSGADLQAESISFYLDIPLGDAEREAASRSFLAELARLAKSSPNESERAQMARLLQFADARTMAQTIRQHRAGRFHVEFRVLDETRLVGVPSLDLEVVDKGAFFDQMLRAK
jgi:hypothetical protein